MGAKKVFKLSQNISKQLHFNATQEDQQLIKKVASEKRLSVSAYCRNLVMQDVLKILKLNSEKEEG